VVRFRTGFNRRSTKIAQKGSNMQWYVDLVTAHPILTAMAQFAVLGTIGEMVSRWVSSKRLHMPFTAAETLWKMVVWSILAICIKYAFVGAEGFVNELIGHHLLPAACSTGFFHAFVKSALTNLQFGLFLVLFHRVLDNVIAKVKNWGNLHKAMLSLIWFWIPAHTLTFCLPREFQIGLAALWSVVLGLILGIFAASAQKAK
jgi:hypothetical protein